MKLAAVARRASRSRSPAPSRAGYARPRTAAGRRLRRARRRADPALTAWAVLGLRAAGRARRPGGASYLAGKPASRRDRPRAAVLALDALGRDTGCARRASSRRSGARRADRPARQLDDLGRARPARGRAPGAEATSGTSSASSAERRLVLDPAARPTRTTRRRRSRRCARRACAARPIRRGARLPAPPPDRGRRLRARPRARARTRSRRPGRSRPSSRPAQARAARPSATSPGCAARTAATATRPLRDHAGLGDRAGAPGACPEAVSPALSRWRSVYSARASHDAAILTIGNEIVSGDIENTNASWLARRLEGLGVAVR